MREETHHAMRVGVSLQRLSQARLPCTDGKDSPFCTFDPSRHFGCFSWTWLLPGVRDLILRALQRGTDHTLSWRALQQAIRKLRDSDVPTDIPGCRRDCLRVPLPGGGELHQALRELHERGDLRYSLYDPATLPARGNRFKAGIVSLPANRKRLR